MSCVPPPISDVFTAGKLSPESLETMSGNAGVMGGMLRITVPQVILHGAQIRALVGQVIAAGVAQHVRPDPAELGLLAGEPDNVVDGLAGQLGLTLGQEQPRQVVGAGGKVALNGAQLVAGNGMLNAKTVLQSGHP